MVRERSKLAGSAPIGSGFTRAGGCGIFPVARTRGRKFEITPTDNPRIRSAFRDRSYRGIPIDVRPRREISARGGRILGERIGNDMGSALGLMDRFVAGMENPQDDSYPCTF